MDHESEAFEERRYCLGVGLREGDPVRSSFTYVEAYPTPSSIILAKAIGQTRAKPALVRMVPRVLEGCIHAAWDDLRYYEREGIERDARGLFFWDDDEGARIRALVTAGADLTDDEGELIDGTRGLLEDTWLGPDPARGATEHMTRLAGDGARRMLVKQGGELTTLAGVELCEHLQRHPGEREETRWLPVLDPAAFRIPVREQDVFLTYWAMLQYAWKTHALTARPPSSPRMQVIEWTWFVDTLTSPGVSATQDAIDLTRLLDRLVALGLLEHWEWGAAPSSHRSQEGMAWFVVTWSEAQRERFTQIPPPTRYFLSTLSRTRDASNLRKREEE